MTSEESRIVGDFGEGVLAYFLTKKGLNVIRADTVFFDLIVRDPYGKLFQKDKIIGISVKIRSSGGTIPFDKDFKKLKKCTKKWNVVPYICFMRIIERKGGNKKLEAFLFEANNARNYLGGTKRKLAISFSKLKKDNEKFKEGENYFIWDLGKY